jgi:hypothetical protein
MTDVTALCAKVVCEMWSQVVCIKGHAVAQVVSRWLPTAAVWVRGQVRSWICGAQSDTGAGFLRLLQFPLSIIIYHPGLVQQAKKWPVCQEDSFSKSLINPVTNCHSGTMESRTGHPHLEARKTS